VRLHRHRASPQPTHGQLRLLRRSIALLKDQEVLVGQEIVSSG
jgi:hypothetical protein